MRFLEQLLEHLQQVAKAPEGLPVPLPVAVDAAACRQDLLVVLERLEAQDSSEAGRKKVAAEHEWWAAADHVVTFAVALTRRLRENFACDATDDEVRRLVRVALARRLGLDDSAGTWTRTLELDRLARLPWDANETAWEDVRRYAEEIHATRVKDGRAHLASLGRVLLDVHGRDAIRWLLHVEVAQSTGPRDPFRLCRETAAYLVAHPRMYWHYDPTEGDIIGRPDLVAEASVERLRALGLLTGLVAGPDDDTPLGYELYPSGRELLAEVSGKTDTPMRLLAHALVQDKTQRALTATQPELAAAVRASAAESVARQARLVAHELRNALAPVQVAFDNLYPLIDQAGASAEVATYRRRIDAGLDRAFRFISETLAPAALLAGEDEPFDVGACLRDALAELNGEAQGQIRLLPLPTLPPVVGVRARFVLALVNLLRNAVQATRERPADIQLAARMDGAWVLVLVDDNGPGIAPEHRQAVFVPGFTLHAGGSGQGLALVKEVVETELRGSISCEASPLGGARFVLRLPIGTRGNG